MIMRLSQIQSGFGLQTAALFILDGLANVIDFVFHFWMGRVLIPSDFAILQTLNSVALVYTTASGVFQPVVSRFIAEARGKVQNDSITAVFQSFLRAAFWIGLILGGFVLVFSKVIAQLFNLPAWTIQIGAVLIFLSTLRPIAAGALQGRQNFIAFGFTRLALSLGRILLVFFLVQAGFGLTGAVIALPFGWLVSVLCAFLLLGKPFWTRTKLASQSLLREGWKLSFYALLAYIAYMSLTSLDLIWVNRNLPGELAGAYAGLVLMRRIVALLPGVAVTVMFPRVVKTLAEGNLSTRILAQTAGIILAVGGALSLLYFMFNEQLITIVFGRDYQAASALLGWMGIAMIGVSLSSIWLNYYLAEKPRTFVILLGIATALEWILLHMFPASLQNAILAFGATGWLLSFAGFVLYVFKIRRLPRRDASQAVSH
ncbi:MAG TPA: oligosaccharide flippase family protein [Anaerolineales bacterium]|nr:oligosaccharide flippase family protein [Anaerolineales bacterium]